MVESEIELSVIIHQTPAALRFGGDGYLITFAGTEQDKAEAAKLMLLNGMPLKMVIRIDDGNTNETTGEEKQSGGKAPRRSWP